MEPCNKSNSEIKETYFFKRIIFSNELYFQTCIARINKNGVQFEMLL